MTSREYRVYGPPGTGKTTWLAKQVRQAAKKHGSQKVVVSSFTRAAAAEIAGRGLPIPRNHVGTLHALAFRQLDNPEIAESHANSWNEECPSILRLSSAVNDVTEISEPSLETGKATEGDLLYAETQKLRAKLVPKEQWSAAAYNFDEKWSEWKQKEGFFDFTDLIETAVEQIDCAPGEPNVGFFDESQDFTPLELSLVRKWSERMDLSVLAGDDDQALYHFKGATSQAFLTPQLPEDQERVLGQSYRIPKKVHELAEKWIAELGQIDERREKPYQPREAEGEALFLPGGSWRQPDTLVNAVERDVADGATVMILGSCSYLINPVKELLRQKGVPFHNPYRRRRGDWNPLRSKRTSTSSAQRLLAYLRPQEEWFGAQAKMWTYEDLKMWVEWCASKGLLKHGAKTVLKEAAKQQSIVEVSVGFLEELFESPEQWATALSGDIDWFVDNLLAKNRKTIKYPQRVLERFGVQGLTDEPSTVIGTIHSVKGGEADVVYILPELSKSGAREWQTTEGRAATLRMFYVAITRARERVVVCDSTAQTIVPLGGLL